MRLESREVPFFNRGKHVEKLKFGKILEPKNFFSFLLVKSQNQIFP